ncbi:MAG: hypothetical protein A2754_02755 [Candidatus Magasanikbacteria bacterium RIFCSPHIGHO2_01_FULL_47_8]|uniref:Uncharacterized protein n=1 Tax=Candidatus Magasanikbacteria bacterium RIFCSPHIGHO2_01_FULL_47_8 TaxID=1798673 RepID=A0A1F6MEQ2_9BACT|nr:MAG: hypothetical protein A2754_02755 [Candidatus Magasanikbacteria bacterium RIFCSPHIGHO2_01_FULL_47_8]
MKTSDKKTFISLILGLLWLGAFVYGGYYMIGLVDKGKIGYIEKKKEVWTTEEKKKQADELKQILARVSKDAQKAEGALLGTDFDSTVDFGIRIEEIARSLGVSHDIDIAARATDLAPSPREDLLDDVLLATFPHIIFDIKVNGSYSTVIRFLERLDGLPYYTSVEQLELIRIEAQEGGAVQASIKLKVFTRAQES